MRSANAHEVAKYIIWKCLKSHGESISPFKLHKLLFYSQAFHLALYDEPLFSDRIEAWSHGPVLPSLDAEYKETDTTAISEETDIPNLPIGTREHVDDVLNAYGGLSGTALEHLTHTEAPWVDARAGTSESATPEIDLASMKMFYLTQLVLDDVSCESSTQK